MDDLIFSLTPGQYKKYLELSHAESVTLDFDFSIPDIKLYPIENVENIIDCLLSDCNKIMAFRNNSTFFSNFSRDEISKLVPIYYDVIDNTSKIRSKLYLEIAKISNIISEIDKALSNINAKYCEFLPYKAALSERCDHPQKTIELDESFKENFKQLNEQKEEEYQKLLSMSTLCDVIIPNLLAESASAADSPTFKNFKEKEFFSAFTAFETQVKNII